MERGGKEMKYAFRLINLTNDKPICIVPMLTSDIVDMACLLHEIIVEEISVEITNLEVLFDENQN
jgi:hypothetical protein